MSKILRKSDLKEYLRELMGGYSIHVPVRETDTVFFRKFTGKEAVELDYETTASSVKSIFFPSGETLLDYKGQDANTPGYDEKTIIFGLHLYDVQALKILDETFSEPILDEYYKRRRDNSIIVAVEHTDVPNSFYAELGLELNEGYDILLTDEGEHYTVNIGSEKGNQIINSGIITDGPESSKELIYSGDKPALDLARISNFLEKGPEQELWHQLAEDCFACGACAYVCPICHCFDLQDQTDLLGTSGTRCRHWDSCMLADFSQVALGGNFRGERYKRIHNWYHHKFCRAVKERGKPDCIGCGRCITICPAKVDIYGTLKKCEELG